MKSWKLNSIIAMTLYGALGLGIQGSAHGPTFTTIDAPGAGIGPGQGTRAVSINPVGVITGGYVDANNVRHGFLRNRNPDGTFTITTIDAPGAGAGPSQGTIPISNNALGAITGYYIDASNVTRGFLRTP